MSENDNIKKNNQDMLNLITDLEEAIKSRER